MSIIDKISKRKFLSIAGLSSLALMFGFSTESSAKSNFKINYTESQWKKKLSRDAYRVLRLEDTERPYSSPLEKEKRAGVFVCAGCGNHLFSSKTKYESGTGWPSVWAPVQDGMGTKTDYKIIMPRTEVHCADCGGHLGHVFNDGPKPTGKRYCMNGVAMKFVAS